MKRLILLVWLALLTGCAGLYESTSAEFPATTPDLFLADGSPCWYIETSVMYGPGHMSCDRGALVADQ